MCHATQQRSLIVLGRTVRQPLFTRRGQSLLACARPWPKCRATDQARPEIASSFFQLPTGRAQVVFHCNKTWAPQKASTSQRALEGVIVDSRCAGRGGNTRMHAYHAHYQLRRGSTPCIADHNLSRILVISHNANRPVFF